MKYLPSGATVMSSFYIMKIVFIVHTNTAKRRFLRKCSSRNLRGHALKWHVFGDQFTRYVWTEGLQNGEQISSF